MPGCSVMKGDLIRWNGRTYFGADDGQMWEMHGAGAVPVASETAHALAEEIGYAETFEGADIPRERWDWEPPGRFPAWKKEQPPLPTQDQRLPILLKLIKDLVEEGRVNVDAGGVHWFLDTQEQVLARLPFSIDRKTLSRDLSSVSVDYHWKQARHRQKRRL